MTRPEDPVRTTRVARRSRDRPSSVQRAPYLIVLAGAGAGDAHRLEATTLIGRDPTSTIRILEDGMSRFHARIDVVDDGVFIDDLESTNGTFVNAQRVRDRLPLRDGDKISMGSTTILKFTYTDSPDDDFHRGLFIRAHTDGLTGVWKRSYFDERLQAECAYARRHDLPLAVLLLDLDHFKSVNDTWGHPAGDAVLVELARRIQLQIRKEDIFARYGGEEFAVICHSTTAPDAARLAERVRTAVAGDPFPLPGTDTTIPITLSIGIGSYPASDVSTSADLVARADAALYEAKRTGRNRVQLAS